MGQKKTKLMLYLTLVEIEVGDELGKILSFKMTSPYHFANLRKSFHQMIKEMDILKNVQDGIYYPLGSQKIPKQKLAKVFSFIYYLKKVVGSTQKLRARALSRPRQPLFQTLVTKVNFCAVYWPTK